MMSGTASCWNKQTVAGALAVALILIVALPDGAGAQEEIKESLLRLRSRDGDY
jgi:hypothetical protein